MTHRPTVIAGNWKMYKTIAESQEYIKQLIPLVRGVKNVVYLAVSFTALRASVEAAHGTNIVIGAQNVSEHADGAYTGEVSIGMLKEAGAKFVIVGHSERRRYFHETDESVNKKVKKVLKHQLQPIMCVGETLEIRESGDAHNHLKHQILKGLHGVSGDDVASLILAYEPIWAIGTGKNATPEIAEEAQRFCRQVIDDQWGKAVANKVVIQYGGSVKPDNAQELLRQPDVDGLLVGGASLTARSFSEIIKG